MKEISRLPHHLDKAKRECQAIIETPKGRRSKFKYDEESGLFSLSNILPQGFNFPFDFGFVPSTKAEDGDPLDVIVLMDEATHVGCLLAVRLVGLFKVVQTQDGKQTANDRVVAVAVRSVEYKDVNQLSDLPKSHADQICEFLALYNKNSGKHDEVKGIEGPDAAVKLVEQAAARFKRQEK